MFFGNIKKSKQQLIKSKGYGQYIEYFPGTQKIKEEGRISNGKLSGQIKCYDQDGDYILYHFQEYRVGAICSDGTRSSATGSGACSWHGGVAEWLYQSKKTIVGGTGKYMPVQQQVTELLRTLGQRLKIKKSGPELQLHLLKQLQRLIENEGKQTKQQKKTKILLQESQQRLFQLQTKNHQLEIKRLVAQKRVKPLQKKYMRRYHSQQLLQNIVHKVYYYQTIEERLSLKAALQYQREVCIQKEKQIQINEMLIKKANRESNALVAQIKKVKDKLEEKQMEQFCVICLNKRKNSMILPCKHASFCNNCLNNYIQKCPCCKTIIEQVIYNFFR